MAVIYIPTAMDPQVADRPVEDPQAAIPRLIREARPVPSIIMVLMTA